MPQTWVLELSSFQLNGVSEFEASAATILNISQDHLDWHSDMDDYIQSKAAIFGEKTQRILNREDPAVMAFVPQPKEKVKQAFGAKTRSKAAAASTPVWVEFGFEMPVRAGDFGVEQVNGMAWLVRALPESGLKIKKNQVIEELEIQRLMPVDALRIFGRHNACNALAALALASTTQAKLAPMLYALREYTGEPHRIQSVQVIDGVEYIDDSKGTNVGATVAALEGLGHDRKLVLILGGDAKGQDMSPLIKPINRFARAVILLGKDAQQIQEALSSVSVGITRVQTMQEAVMQASRVAKNADAVVLSPACSSLDMFKNYAHRAHVFAQAVQELSEMGEIEGTGASIDQRSDVAHVSEVKP
jgi:UDP-N-acetylmuramoylalanine--D-glutamate ligase